MNGSQEERLQRELAAAQREVAEALERRNRAAQAALQGGLSRQVVARVAPDLSDADLDALSEES